MQKILAILPLFTQTLQYYRNLLQIYLTSEILNHFSHD